MRWIAFAKLYCWFFAICVLYYPNVRLRKLPSHILFNWAFVLQPFFSVLSMLNVRLDIFLAGMRPRMRVTGRCCCCCRWIAMFLTVKCLSEMRLRHGCWSHPSSSFFLVYEKYYNVVLHLIVDNVWPFRITGVSLALADSLEEGLEKVPAGKTKHKSFFRTP